jgi:hypothetical protein
MTASAAELGQFQNCKTDHLMSEIQVNRVDSQCPNPLPFDAPLADIALPPPWNPISKPYGPP